MLYELLVRNYYETHGNFKGIQLTTVGDWLEDAAKQLNFNVTDLCYRILGYRSYGDYTAADVCQIRKDAVLEIDEAKRKKLIKEIKSSDEGYSIPTLLNLKKDFGELEDIFLACYAYYRDCCHGMVEYADGSLIDMSRGLNLLRANVKSFNKLWTSMKRNKSCLTYSKVTSDGVTVTNGVCCSAKTVSEEQFEEISYNAMLCVIYGLSTDLSIALKKYNDLGILSIKQPSLYLKLLDMANALGITYAQMMSEIGINVPDQFVAFNSKYNCIILMTDANGISTIVDNTCDIDHPFKRKELI